MSRKIVGRTVGTTLNPEKLKTQAGGGSESGSGENGATFTPAVDADGNLSWTNDKGLANPETVNIKGPKGDTPFRGTDYWTETDKTEIKSYCQDYIDTELLGGAS